MEQLKTNKTLKRLLCVFSQSHDQPTEHGLQFDEAAGEVVKVDDLIVGVSSHQHLMQLVVQFEACGRDRSQVSLIQQSALSNNATLSTSYRHFPAPDASRRSSCSRIYPDQTL